jgi:hypothetical protein
VTYEDKTRDELRDELKRRDLPVSGSKSELVERLEEADQEDGEQEPDVDDGQADDEQGSDEQDEAAVDGDAGDGENGTASSSDRSDGSARSGSGGSGGRLKPMQLVRLAGAQLMQLTGRDIDGTSGIERTDEGWRVLFEVVEVTRVPRAMDVLGLYEVIVDADGDLVRYERIRRFVRTQTEDGE